ncbi:hypothetical protein B1779_01415 [Dehalococcoides mccartyi]|nr:hypothetical protein B1779_01415 [Dehalococcoides mccartyi]
MDEKTKRRLLHNKLSNDELFSRYYDLLKLRLPPNQCLQYKAALEKIQSFNHSDKTRTGLYA